MLRGSIFGTALNGGIAATVIALAGTTPANAAENGVGLYLLGSRGVMAGYLPPPGLYVQNDTYYYDGKLGGNARLPTGGEVIANVEGQVVADFITGTWVLPWEVLGGNLAIGAIVPFGRPRVDADIILDPAELDPIEVGVTDRASVFGDLVGMAALGWHSGKWHWNITGLLNFPVGDYREGEIANLAFHRWAGDISAAVTWMDPELGLDLSAAAGFTFNGTNEVTDYTTGTEFHLEWAISKNLTKQFSIGFIGYYYDQITGDSGPGARLGPFEGRVTALGGTIGYNFEVGHTPVSTRLKVFREFDVENRVEGTAGFLTVAFPFAVNKPPVTKP